MQPNLADGPFVMCPSVQLYASTCMHSPEAMLPVWQAGGGKFEIRGNFLHCALPCLAEPSFNPLSAMIH